MLCYCWSGFASLSLGLFFVFLQRTASKFLKEIAKMSVRKEETHKATTEKINDRNFTFIVRTHQFPAKILACLVGFVGHLAEVPKRRWQCRQASTSMFNISQQTETFRINLPL